MTWAEKFCKKRRTNYFCAKKEITDCLEKIAFFLESWGKGQKKVSENFLFSNQKKEESKLLRIASRMVQNFCPKHVEIQDLTSFLLSFSKNKKSLPKNLFFEEKKQKEKKVNGANYF